jgi:hypothetical protein
MQFNRFFYDGLVSFSSYQKWTHLGCDNILKLNPHRRHRCESLFNTTQTAIGVVTQQLNALPEDHQKDRHIKAPQPDLDPDCLYQDFCTGNGTLNTYFGNPDSCDPGGQKLSTYLNRQDVQTAIHARAPDASQGNSWQTCSDSLNYTMDLADAGLLPFLRRIFKTKPTLRILYYSGDVDVATVPQQTTQACLAELGDRPLPNKSWRPWTINGWHAGYVEEFERHTYATIKGAGHEAPQYQPLIAFHLFERFLRKGNIDEPNGRDSVEVGALGEQALSRIAGERTQGSVLRMKLSKLRATRGEDPGFEG